MILIETSNGTTENVCLSFCAPRRCPSWCFYHCPIICNSGVPLRSHRYSNLQIATISFVGAVLIGIIFCIAVPRFGPSRTRRDLRDIAGEEFRGEGDEHRNEGCIDSIGLETSVIRSITLLEYKKDDGLLEGAGCAVCLSEFRDGESLRLLPNCSHAFHVLCIDTWLETHVNCPMCRAAIVSTSEGKGTVSEAEDRFGIVGGETLIPDYVNFRDVNEGGQVNV